MATRVRCHVQVLVLPWRISFARNIQMKWPLAATLANGAEKEDYIHK
jgi:hypothetical protein